MIHFALEEIPGHVVKSSETPVFLKKQCTDLVFNSSTTNAVVNHKFTRNLLPNRTENFAEIILDTMLGDYRTFQS